MEPNQQNDKQKPKSKKQISNRERGILNDEVLTALVDGCRTEQDLFGPDGVFTKLKAAVMERVLKAEIEHHLGHPPHGTRTSTNARNGSSKKTVTTESGPVDIQVPRDRESSFEPKFIGKHQRRLEGFDEKVLALYGRGMTTRDISEHLRELYGTDVSHELISHVTASVLPEFQAWQNRPLESVYPVLYIDAIFVPVRDGAGIKKRPFYVALGVSMDGRRDVLGLWTTENESAKFWLEIFSELKNRGVEDIFFICADGLSGIDKAIEAAFQNAVYQTCVVHLIRNAMKYVSFEHRKAMAADFRAMYTAPTVEAAEAELDKIEATWGKKYPSAIRTWRSRWTDFIPFLAYAPEVRRILYTTNAIESVNSQLRKSLRHRGPFPNLDSVFKVFFLSIQNAKTRWKAAPGWTAILANLEVTFEGRLPL